MNDRQATVSLDEAKRQVALVCRRLALLHLAFAEVMVEALGEDEGKRLVERAVKEYGGKIGDAKRRAALSRGLETNAEAFAQVSDLPSFGMHDGIEAVTVEGEKRIRAHGCVMGKVWCEQGRPELGRLYCHVDPAGSMAFNSAMKLVHTKSLPDGDPYCELVMRPTTAADREAFAARDTDWEAIERSVGEE